MTLNMKVVTTLDKVNIPAVKKKIEIKSCDITQTTNNDTFILNHPYNSRFPSKMIIY